MGSFVSGAQPEEQGTIASLLQILAAYDLDEYQSLLANLALIVPAEVEEELYRFRTARTREYGFVSYEEAISVYAPLKMDEVCQKETLRPHVISIYDDSLPVPATPFALLQQEQLLVQACRRAPDAAFRDRMQIEFADLCNLVLAADITEPPVDQEMVARAWLRAGYYLEIALNRWTDRDVAKAEKILRTHSLETIFRVGWGFVMNLRTEARKWQQTSWAHTAGKAPDFWGTPWGAGLAGLLKDRPLFYDNNTFRDFTSWEDLEVASQLIEELRLLELLLLHHLPAGKEGSLLACVDTFHPLLFVPFVHHVLGDEPTCSPLSRDEVSRFFRFLRTPEESPAPEDHPLRNAFLHHLLSPLTHLFPREVTTLRGILIRIWDDFGSSYEKVAEEDLDLRFIPHLFLRSP